MENPNPDPLRQQEADQRPPTPQPPAQPPVQPPVQPPAPQPAPGSISEKQWILFLNLSALAGFVVPSLGHILGPLIIWLVKKEESPAIDAAGRDVLNFQISWTIWIFASIVAAAFGSCLVVPIFLPFAAVIAWLVIVIIGSVKASNGEAYTFPLTIKIL